MIKIAAFVLALALVCWVVLELGYRFLLDYDTRDWQPVEAQVVYYGVRCCWNDRGEGPQEYLHMRYQYEVNGELKVSDRLRATTPRLNNRGEALYLWYEQRQFSVGQQVTAYIDASGERAILELGFDYSQLFEIFIVLASGFNFLVLLAELIRRHKPSDARGRFWSGDN